MNRVSYTLLAAVSILVLLGVLMLDSATVTEAVPRRFHAHLAWLGVGAIIAGAAALTDYAILRRFHLPRWLLGLAVLLLALVLVPGIGPSINGARRWLPFGGQPSELAKLAIILWLADYAATHLPRMNERQIGFLQPGVVCGLVVCLIFLEPDWGTAALVATVSMAMLLVAGARWSYLIPLSILGAIGFAALLASNSVRLPRWICFTDPEKYQVGIGWQGWHSVLAIGSGGLSGTLFGEGSHKFGFVPEQQTDFVFSLVGEELGFIGTSSVLLLFTLIVLCGIRISWRITDPFGQLLASGLTILIGLQAAINIGVCTSSLPNKGIPLPFLSYGGSSTIAMLVAAGLLLSIARHAPMAPTCQRLKPLPSSGSPFTRNVPVASLGLPSLCPPRERGLCRKALFYLRRLGRGRRVEPVLRSYQRSVWHTR